MRGLGEEMCEHRAEEDSPLTSPAYHFTCTRCGHQWEEGRDEDLASQPDQLQEGGGVVDIEEAWVKVTKEAMSWLVNEVMRLGLIGTLSKTPEPTDAVD